MAAAELSDGGRTDGYLKFRTYMDRLPNVNEYFLSRCINAVDTEIYRGQGKEAQKQSRDDCLTFVKALRTLARRICLDPGENLRPEQTAEITRTREFLGPEFFQKMGFYGVDIVHAAGVWTFTESRRAEEVVDDYELGITRLTSANDGHQGH
ncbi:hypothetical protein KVR01_012453 [Diaporthe batatas]|uniref:uncharacterized protein n=1 Tax=Diaporthe batatas TaxID=748121 RepID=UPI001D036678|nr:uncharacterized protein KVR01_012453 [Diaporthe batatas]KAG8157791.1 hypothetical protein KVR01_012453 [Diaporthe batatas]